MYEQRTVSVAGQYPDGTAHRALDYADRLGLTELYSDARTLMDRAVALTRVRGDSQTELARGRARILDQLADGTLTPEKAAAEYAGIEALGAERGAIPELVRDASRAAVRKAWAGIVDYGDRVITTDLRPIVDQAVTDTVGIAGQIPEGVWDSATAVSAGTDIAGLWAQLTELRERWALAHRLADHLRGAGALLVDDPHRWPIMYRPVDYMLAHPDRVSRGVQHSTPAPLWLAAVHAAGAEPGIYTADEVAARAAVQSAA